MSDAGAAERLVSCINDNVIAAAGTAGAGIAGTQMGVFRRPAYQRGLCDALIIGASKGALIAGWGASCQAARHCGQQNNTLASWPDLQVGVQGSRGGTSYRVHIQNHSGRGNGAVTGLEVGLDWCTYCTNAGVGSNWVGCGGCSAAAALCALPPLSFNCFVLATQLRGHTSHSRSHTCCSRRHADCSRRDD